MKIKQLLTFVVLTLFFSGCINITTTLPAYTNYALSMKDTKPILQEKTNNKSLRVAEPSSTASLNTHMILYSKDDLLLQNYELSKWIDKPTKMLQELITDKLYNQSRFKHISKYKTKFISDYTLQSELVTFKQQFIGNESYGRLKIRFYLSKHGTSKVISKQFSYNIRTKTSNARGAVEALNIAANKMLDDMVDWLNAI